MLNTLSLINQIEQYLRQSAELARVRATILALVHVHNRPITYKELALALKVNVRGLGPVLGQLLAQDFSDKLPLTCALVVNSVTCKPSDGFFEGLIYNQIVDVDDVCTQAQREALWALELKKFPDVKSA